MFMVGGFLQKMQLARAEFEEGKPIMEILFSDNPGLIPRRETAAERARRLAREAAERARLEAEEAAERARLAAEGAKAGAAQPPIAPALAPPLARAPTPTRAPAARPTASQVRAQAVAAQQAKIKVKQARKSAELAKERAKLAAEKAKARVPAPPTDVLSTLGRGLARVTGAKTQPPPSYTWKYFS